jgi:hypothetical protein
MNLLGQQHPEYLALMWGVMKIVFDVSLASYFQESRAQTFGCV